MSEWVLVVAVAVWATGYGYWLHKCQPVGAVMEWWQLRLKERRDADANKRYGA